MGRTEHRSGGVVAVVKFREPDIGAARAAAQQVVIAEVRAAIRAAEARWPVKTGRSRAGLDVDPIDGGARATDPVSYAGEVRLRDGRLAWVALVVEPLRADGVRIATAARDAYARKLVGA